MAAYNREEVAVEIEDATRILVGLPCEPRVSHAINIVLAHVEHQTESLADSRALAKRLYEHSKPE